MARVDGRLEALEELLVRAVKAMHGLPDRERGWLRAGARSGWPDIVREANRGEYDARGGDGSSSDVPLRMASASRRDMDLIEALFLAPGCLADAVPSRDRALVGKVLVARGAPDVGGFTWARIWVACGGRRCGVTSDALRVRYERALGHMLRRAGTVPLVWREVLLNTETYASEVV